VLWRNDSSISLKADQIKGWPEDLERLALWYMF